MTPTVRCICTVLIAVLRLRGADSDSTAAENDSTTYTALRNRIAATDPVNQALATADALAEAGLYEDALELLREHAPAPDSLPRHSGSLNTTQKTASWRWSSGIDYYHLEDFDNATMTPEEERDYRRLTETPLSVWSRLSATLTPWRGSQAVVLPELYLSERKSRLETAIRYQTPGGAIGMEPAIKAEKWFRSDASDASHFRPGTAQPSDMLGAALRCTIGNSERKQGPLHFAVPLAVDWEHYREDRPGYESFIEYRCYPNLEIEKGILPLHLRLSAEIQFEDYYRDVSDYLDVVRLAGRLEGMFRGAAGTSTITAAWMGDRYHHDTLLSMINRCEGGANCRYSFGEHLLARLRLRGIYEIESAPRSSDLSGGELSALPGIDLQLFDRRLSIGPDMQWERRHAQPVDFGDIFRYVWEARNAFETGLHFGWDGAVMQAAARAAFRYENIDPDFERFTGDNRSFRGNAEVSVAPLTFLSIDAVIDYQYRYYPVQSRRSENLSVSLNATARW